MKENHTENRIDNLASQNSNSRNELSAAVWNDMKFKIQGGDKSPDTKADSITSLPPAPLTNEQLSELKIGVNDKRVNEMRKFVLEPVTDGLNYRKSNSDSLLNDQEQKREVIKTKEEEEKLTQSERLAPAVENIKKTLTPEMQAELKKNGLESEPDKIRNGIVDAMRSDNMSTAMMQKRGDGDFPIMAGYMATGLMTGEQRQQILDEQKQKRAQWRLDHPDAEKGSEFKQYQTGELLRDKFGKDKVDAADALLKQLQPAAGPQK